jgi:hypothetical protein
MNSPNPCALCGVDLIGNEGHGHGAREIAHAFGGACETLKRALPPLAFLTPTPETMSLDGVEARVWAGVTETGSPLRLAVHRVFLEPEHEAATLAYFPILEPRATPKRLELSSSIRLLDEARGERDRFKAALERVVALCECACDVGPAEPCLFCVARAALGGDSCSS